MASQRKRRAEAPLAVLAGQRQKAAAHIVLLADKLILLPD